ncbi:MAG: ABC-2 transporter permease [Firmicutes bacterium]|nr:ABC-2 transporter permease [Bacillota bacterium]
MKNIKALIGLDFKLVAPYWKWWLMFLAIALAMSILNQDGGLFILFMAMFGMTMMAFPFEVTEKSNMDVLFATLPTNRKSIVLARFGSTLISLFVIMLISLPVGLIIHAAFGNTINFSAFAIFTCFSIGVFLVSVSVQTPFMYKHGYKKGRIFMWIPLIVFIIIFNLPNLFELFNWDVNFNIFEILFRNTAATVLISLGAGAIAYVISFFMSNKIYLKKDL